MYNELKTHYASDPNRLLSRKEAADMLGMQPSTLAAWATLRKGDLPFLKIGARAKYRLADVQRFIDRSYVGGKSNIDESCS